MDKPEKKDVLLKHVKFAPWFDDGECPVCYSKPQVIKAAPQCGHVFCRSCLLRCTNNECPVCVQEFSHFVHLDEDGNTVLEIVQPRWGQQLVPGIEPEWQDYLPPILLGICSTVLSFLLFVVLPMLKDIFKMDPDPHQPEL